MKARRTRAALLLIVLALGGPALDLAPPRALAAELDEDEVARLQEEGTRWFQRAGDTDLSRKQRNEALKQAYDLLQRADRMLDAHCDAHPEDIERLDAQMVRVNMMMFWIRKEAPLGVLGGSAPASRPPPKRPTRPGPSTEPGTEPGAEPSEDEVGPPIMPPTPPTPPTRESTPLEQARDHDQQRSHDISGALDLWLEVLDGTEDRDSAIYQQALGRVSALSARLREEYVRLRDDDPDSIEGGAPPGKEAQIAGEIAADLGVEDAATRIEAADRLAALGYGPAALPLRNAVRSEKDAKVRDRMFLALVRLGGRRTCEALGRFARERKPDLVNGAVSSLTAIGAKGTVPARYAGLALSEFVLRAKGAGPDAIRALRTLGPPGVPGLVAAIQTKDVDLEVGVISALGSAKDPRGADVLAARLLEKDKYGVRDAAMNAVKSIGRPAVPALIDALGTRKTRRYAAIALYELTGETLGEDGRAWAVWWKENREL